MSKAMALIGAAVLTGCTAVQTAGPYVAPVRIIYCSSPPEARQALRDAYGLPHIVWCLSDYTRAEVEAAAHELGIDAPEVDESDE